MADVEIGKGKVARRGYELADISIVPTRRTRDPEAPDTSWELDATQLDLPIVAAPVDSAVSPSTAAAIAERGALAVLNLEGLWTRYEDPAPVFDELAACPDDTIVKRLQQAYAEPIQPELIVARLHELKDQGLLAAGALRPQTVERYTKEIVNADPDLLFIHGTVVSAEHVSYLEEPLNLKRFIREFEIPVVVGGCASYRAALHLMRTGAVGVLVGVGTGHASNVTGVTGVGMPQATAIADAAGARMQHLDETGVYVHVIANGGLRSGGDIAKAVACGADAAVLGATFAAAHGAPGQGWHWGTLAHHPTLPRGVRVHVGQIGTLDEILFGPASGTDDRLNVVGALRAAMAMSGSESVKELQKADVAVRGQ